ncbi:MAG: polysulfide reductase NrfD, partial [Candidatus Omnitrophica bacterium]|nr:polysulfide reductase NrfD [Candidatus Omnitrophota bacterium]
MFTILNKNILNMRIDKKVYLSFCLFGTLIVLSGPSFLYQILKGMGVTGLKEPVVWGLYVVNFTFFLGMGAGILMILAFFSTRSDITDELRFFLSICAFIILSIAGIFIIVDLGRVDRFYYMIIYAKPQSPLFWDFVALNVFFGVSLLFCFVALRGLFLKKGLNEKNHPVVRLIYRIV